MEREKKKKKKNALMTAKQETRTRIKEGRKIRIFSNTNRTDERYRITTERLIGPQRN